MEWRPIETVAENTDFIGMAPAAEGIVCVHCWIDEKRQVFDVWGDPIDIILTHWMPLPEPPK